MSDTPSTRGEFQRIRGRYAGYTRTRLAQFARRLRRAIYPERAAVENIEIAGPTGRIPYEQATKLGYRDARLGEPLGPLWATYWVRVTARIPEDWRGARVDLHWDSRSEALLYLDGQASQGLNNGRNFARVTPAAKGGETVTLYIEIACNRAFGNAEQGLPPREPYRLEACELRRFDPAAWELFHDFDVLRQLEADREPKQGPRSTGGVGKVVRPALDTTWAGKLLHDLNRAVNVLDPDDAGTWPEGRAIIAGLLGAKNGTVVHELSAIGHAHIDTAWLWPIEETRRKCRRSFANVLALMDEYPQFKFACSQAAQYVMMEEDDPALFARIKAAAARGQWIPIGGSWVEPDCNLPSGESMSRQFLYGQRYFERTFGARARIFWNPDVFGYAGQLPQLMREAGMDRFLTQKLSWNRFTVPPHHSFFWRGLDGSEVLTHFPPADTYNGMATMEELRYHAANHKDADRTAEALYLFGYGDGGGGPDAVMIESLARTRDLLGVPRSETRDPNDFFDRLEADAHDFATVEGELYFEYHRGTYTSQSEVKRLNRKLEGDLQTLDFLSAVAALNGKPVPSRTEIESLWRVLLTNQFHDILPGSSITEVYERTRRELSELDDTVTARIRDLLGPTAPPSPRPDDNLPINTTGVARDEIDRAPNGELCRVVAPPFGAGRIEERDEDVASADSRDVIVLRNDKLGVRISRAGLVTSLVQRTPTNLHDREVLAGPVNRFALFDDRPTEYEAWDIDPFALETGRETGTENVRCSLFEREPQRASVRVERAIGKRSFMRQIISLDAGAGHLAFDVEIDWQERKSLLKAIFPLAVKSPRATYETMYGAVERPTHASTDADLAQYEVPGHRWADLSEPGFGVSLLTDSRYGYSTFGSTMSLTLLRGTESPDATADLGTHRLRYALYPHDGDWRQAGTTAQALRFNRPLLWAATAPLARPLVTCDAANVIIDTIKPAEDGQGWIIRLYEAHGMSAKARLRIGLPVRTLLHRSNTLEDVLEPLDPGAPLTLRPFQILTLRVTSPSP
jgi:alpha-mannosidase